MISVPEARQLIADKCKILRKEDLPLPESLGYVLAEDIFSAIDTPPFDQAAVDGYAFSFGSWNRTEPLKVQGKIQAGNAFEDEVPPGHAVRIFTGAPVPRTTDTVVMQEKVEVLGSTILINDEQLVKGSNVRPQGSQTRQGDKALQKGHLMTPASISFLAGLGIGSVKVFAKPKVRIIVTGNELSPPGVPLKEGKIYESNAAGLTAALKISGITPRSIEVIDDNELAIMHAINRSSDADILILTGGASVGDYDFVPSALSKCGVLRVFHKVKQKPGKPFFFGIEGDMLVFALPGNPAAVLTCYYEYIVPSIATMEGKTRVPGIACHLINGYKKRPGLTYFLKGKKTGDQVQVLESQESYLMNSFAHADCLIELDEEKEVYTAGDAVNVMMIN